MAMNPMQKKARTSFLLGMFLTLIVTGLIMVFLILQISKMKQEQDAIVYKQVYVVSTNIESGDLIQGKVKLEQVRAEHAPNNAITSGSLATYITEKSTAKIGLKAGTVITTDMINVDGVSRTSDTRLQEYNMIILPSQLEEGQTIDIRLRLPSGEDYIVISKKIVKQADSETVWMEVSEDEILTMSNAIVEAYIMEGSLLYATTYADAGDQNASTPTYIVSNTVVELMNIDPNITATAKLAIAERYTERVKAQRTTINAAINSYTDSALTNVETNVADEIERQKTARQEYVDGLK